jgi:mannose-1-phosphate guanylyltransferase/phosphomannomutase
VRRLVKVMGADLGIILEPGAERMYIVDEKGEEIPLEKALLLFVKLVSQEAKKGQKIALPLTVTKLAEEIAALVGVAIERTKVSLPALMDASTARGVVFAGTMSGGYIFPKFLPGFDAIMSFGKLLELLAPHAQTLSEQIAELPTSTLVHKTVGCPWSLKGTVMRTVTERMQKVQKDGKGKISLLDGIKVFQNGSWAQILPDADEAVFHVYAEGNDPLESEKMADRFVRQVRRVIDENRRELRPK